MFADNRQTNHEVGNKIEIIITLCASAALSKARNFIIKIRLILNSLLQCFVIPYAVHTKYHNEQNTYEAIVCIILLNRLYFIMLRMRYI